MWGQPQTGSEVYQNHRTIPEMLEKVDDGSMGFTPAVQLSFLKKKEQKEMLDVMEFAQCTLSYQQTLSGWISPNCAKRVCWRKGY